MSAQRSCPLMIGMALTAAVKGYAAGNPVLIEASGDDGACGCAAILARRGRPDGGRLRQRAGNLRQGSDAKTIAALPDVCFTPPENPATPPGVPVPYPSFGMASDTENGTGTVKIGGKTVNIKNKSDVSKTSGTEAGCAAKKGIITSKNTGRKYFNSLVERCEVRWRAGDPVFTIWRRTTTRRRCRNTPPWVEIAGLDLGKGNCILDIG